MLRKFKAMRIPDYTITNHILKNIASIEYSKAIIESTVLLQNWEKQLEIEARGRTITYSLQRAGVNVLVEDVKRHLNKIPARNFQAVNNYEQALKKVEEASINKEFDENDIKNIYLSLNSGKDAKLRSRSIKGTTEPQEILAELGSLLDWYTSFDALQEHPLIRTALFKCVFEQISPFEHFTVEISDLVALLCLKTSGYALKDYFSLQEYFYQTQNDYEKYMKMAHAEEDCTKWLEYFTEGLNREISNVAENIKILAKDAKIAKAAGTVHLSDRQQKIITYLQDYGMIQNKDFEPLFPKVSEDTVLRELKDLIDKGIVVKRGKTKSSRYELS